ncbi:MAG: FtsH protease activity modulator HflK, partial [Armatimonadota bacterium]
QRAPVQRLADRYATYFVPIVIVVAAVTLLATRDMLRAVAVLIIACPCALVLATPTAVVAGIGWLARRGILVKGGAILEQMGRIDALLLDKTGTVTEGRLELVDVLAFGRETADSVLQLAAAAESRSEHLIARLITDEAQARALAAESADEFSVRPGLGVEATVADRRVLVGNRQLLAQAGVDVSTDAADTIRQQEERGCTVVLVASGEALIGAVAVRDAPRAGARDTINRLRALGLEDIGLVTGDNERVAQAVAADVGITDVSSELLPDGKVERLRELQARGRTVAMIGDGVNDAPSLAAADVGIAMGAIGTDVTVEAADVVLIADELPRLADLVEMSRRALRTIRQNILYFAIIFNFAAVMAAAFGYAKPVVAAVVHQVSSLLVVCNSLRLLLEQARAPRFVARLREGISAPLAAAGGWLGGIDWRRGAGWLREHRRRVAEWALAAALALYALSGVFIVRPGEVGVVRVFGRLAQSAVRSEGLRYRPPWPMGSMTKVQVTQVRIVGIGFRLRSEAEAAETGVPAYEWNIQHRAGRYERRPEEGLQFTGDHNLVEVNAAVHYSIRDPVAYLLNASEPHRVLQAAAESALRAVVATRTLDDVLVGRRAEIEQTVLTALRKLVREHDTGLDVRTVRLQDIHPPLEVVDAFRDVSSAEEDKARVVNEAQAYANDVLPKARGQKDADIIAAEAYAEAAVDRAHGAAARFTPVAEAYRAGPSVTGQRLYLETLERSMSDLKKVIVDPRHRGRRQMIFLDSGGLRILPGQPAGQPAAPPAETVPPEPPPGGWPEAEIPPAE